MCRVSVSEQTCPCVCDHAHRKSQMHMCVRADTFKHAGNDEQMPEVVWPPVLTHASEYVCETRPGSAHVLVSKHVYAQSGPCTSRL